MGARAASSSLTGANTASWGQHRQYGSQSYVTVRHTLVMSSALQLLVLWMKIKSSKREMQTFVIGIVNQVQRRLPENVDIFLMLKCFHPLIATPQTKESLAPIGARFLSAFEDMDDLANEWSNLGLHQWPKS